MDGTLIDGIGLAQTDALVTPTNGQPVDVKVATYSSLVAAFDDIGALPPIRATTFNERTIYYYSLN